MSFRDWIRSCTRSATTSSSCCELLRSQHVLVVQGSGFNWPHTDHLRIVTLPRAEDLTEAIGRLGEFLADYRPLSELRQW